MKKGFIYSFVFVASIAMSATFQSCGKSSVQANSSDNDGLQVDVEPIVGDNGEEPQCTDDAGKMNLNCGDNLFYVTTSQATERVATVRVLLKSYYVMMETHVYEAPSVEITKDLPASYCQNSALPHCAHLNPFVCQGFGCFEGPQPVRCHWQKRMSKAEQQATFSAISEIRYLNRVVDNESPYVAGCNDPSLSFFKENSTVNVSLAPIGCVPEGETYANGQSGEGSRTLFNGEIVKVESFLAMDNNPEFCNNFSAYSYDTTKFTYHSISGYTTPETSYEYTAEYEALPVENDPQNRMYGAIDLRWKVGTADEKCVFDFPLNLAEYDAFFPGAGLKYDVFRPNDTIADVGLSTITYSDPADGGAEWKFFLSRGAAMLPNGGGNGGAVIKNDQATAIRNMIENTIIPNAEDFAQACP